MVKTLNNKFGKLARLLLPIAMGLMITCALIFLVRSGSTNVNAAPIEPPTGYPKLLHSTFVVTPELAGVGGATLGYHVEIVNTGAYTAVAAVLTSTIPANTVYNEDGWASDGPTPVVSGSLLTWMGDVGFDSSVLITFSVNVSPTFEGVITNTAVINHPDIPEPVLLEADARITDSPVLEISKTTPPILPGPEKPLTYTITVLNVGQACVGLPITVTEQLPISTTFVNASDGWAYDPDENTVTWNLDIDLAYMESTDFWFVVEIGDVLSGTVINNFDYHVAYSDTEMAVGLPYTVTVVDPELFIHKTTQPDPPGSNTDVDYELTVLNKGSLATGLVISDRIPTGVEFMSGGDEVVDGVVYWYPGSLNTNELVVVSYTVHVGDIMDVEILNEEYGVCSAEGVCDSGSMLISTIWGPTFEAWSYVDPIAKKPGGGTGTEVTPTLVVKNVGPGNAYDATALLKFERIQVSGEDLLVIPDSGIIVDGPECGDKCVAYVWQGDVLIGDVITFTTSTGQNSVGGEEGTFYTATVVITDQLGLNVTEPVTGTSHGVVTHLPNLIPTKSGPPVIGRGQLMTYTIDVQNTGLSTNTPPFPVLTETVPASVTLISIGEDGISSTVAGTTTISWTLPSLSTGDSTSRHFTVQVPLDLVSGTQIINDRYRTMWWEGITSTIPMSNTGIPVTTTVKEVGLIDSFKEVIPQFVPPAETNVLTYVVHIVNSSPISLTDVRLYDWLPWENSTYNRDAFATSGEVISDIVSVEWIGDVAALSTELLTFTVNVDPWFEGTITNTVAINHTSLLTDVIRSATAYITDDPVLFISKIATPSPVALGSNLLYTIQIDNLGWQATELTVTDTVPLNTTYIPGSASGGGQFVDGELVWTFPVLPSLETYTINFQVTVNSGDEVVNEFYGVNSSEGVSATGDPVVTPIIKKVIRLFLPFTIR